MSLARAPYGVVSLAALDLRRRPGHRSEMRSQLLTGEVVRVLRRSKDGLWRLVENETDGYRGWVRSWGLVGASARRTALWRRRASARVVRAFAELRASPGAGALVSPLFWQARAIPKRRRGRYRQLELPDGRTGWTEVRALEVGRRSSPPLLRRVRDLLGVPYLWGGRTPSGLDCSGFTQLVLAEQGIRLPRDADAQERSARPLGGRERVRPGDLVFFGGKRGRAGHVGIALGGGYYAHVRGRVAINSLEPDNVLYDNVLGGQFRDIRRAPKRA